MDDIDRLLAELREENARAEQAAEATERAEAARWLAKLDRESPEGEWFEQFAERFPTPVEAAVAYRRALGKTGV